MPCPQDAYISLNTSNGSVDVGYQQFDDIDVDDEDILFEEWAMIKFDISPTSDADEIGKMIEEIREDLQRILDGSGVYYDLVGDPCVHLSDDASTLVNSIDDMLRGHPAPTNRYILDAFELPEMLEGDFPKEGEPVNAYVERLLSRDGDDDMFFADDINDFVTLKRAVLEIWVDWVSNTDEEGITLPKHVVAILVEEGLLIP